ncbi:MAG TPA: FAD-dependent oxidoreductase [Sphingomicrobium sp.]|nr:FAD-dependent oxidoreductase [Sphingomicrobium sp.]
MSETDILIVGGGIAGASLGAELAAHRRVLLIEAESQCGVHATGRSAAFWLESYGGATVAQLTTASRAFLDSPPAGFSERGFLRSRGDLHITCDELPEVPPGIDVRIVERPELEQMVPGIRPEWRRALFEPSCADIDVAGLHAAYLRQFRRDGGEVRTDVRFQSAEWSGGRWAVRFGDGSTLTASLIINAAGAWADQVAGAAGVQPLAIHPKRRTMVQLRVGRSGLRDLPLVDDAGGTFYFKGEGDRTVWLSPHDEIDSEPCDAAPDEIDVAIAIDRFEKVVDWPIEAVERRWAGLRTFAPDRIPVYGLDPDAPGLFWCAGQGGFGIQTAPAAAKMAGSLILGTSLDARIAGIDPAPFSPARFR